MVQLGRECGAPPGDATTAQHERLRMAPGSHGEIPVIGPDQRGHPEAWQPVLHVPQDIAFATLLEVDLREREAVVEPRDRGQPHLLRPDRLDLAALQRGGATLVCR